MALQAEDDGKGFLLDPVSKEAVVTDLLKTRGKDMQHKAPDKLHAGNCDFPVPGCFVVKCGKGDVPVSNRPDPGIGDCNPVGITPEVLDCVSVSVKCFLDENIPVFLIKGITECIPFVPVYQLCAGVWYVKAPGTVKGLQGSQELPPEEFAHDSRRDEERILPFDKLKVTGQAVPGNDAVDMGMVVQLLAPGMEQLDDAWHGTKVFFIRRKLENGLRYALMQERIKHILVRIDHGIQFGRYGCDKMEVSGVDHFRSPAVDPGLLENGLADRAVAIAA